MNYFIQREPGFSDIGKPQRFEFNDLEELLNQNYIKSWSNNPKFYRYSLSDDMLMCELDDGKAWWILGYIEHPEQLTLPRWVAVKNDK